jgi:uncharacterized repeat protein (TIGR03803 family)
MWRSILRGAGMLFLLACVRLALPPDVAAASSGKIIYSFAGGADGAYPESDLIMDSAGNLYGTTSAGGTGCGNNGCGTVFELARTKNGWKHQVLYSFAGSPNDGADPKAGLAFDSAGNLYGTTTGGGDSNCGGGCGTVLRLAPNSRGGWTESILYRFGGYSGGMHPASDLVFDSQGNLYGTAGGGTGTGFCGGQFWGGDGCGIVFRLTPNPDGTWTESTIYDFAGAPDAAVPIGSLVLDVDGSMYGATSYGGPGPCILGHNEFNPPYGCGALYKLTPSGGGWKETVIYSFSRGQGLARNPSGGLILDKPGRLLGTSWYGGDGDGAFFQLEQTKEGWEQSIPYRFYGNPDGSHPVGRLSVGPQGNLFGAGGGGTNRSGTVFELERTTRGWKERVVFSFGSADVGPSAGPTVNSQDHVYGTLSDIYSSHFGEVYEVIP